MNSAQDVGTAPGASQACLYWEVNSCTLRQAIEYANAHKYDEVRIEVPASLGTLELTIGQLVVESTNFTIYGGAIIHGGDRFRIFYINDGATAFLSSLTLTHGNGLPYDGGAIYVHPNAGLYLNNVRIQSNRAAWGGGIRSDGGLSVVDSEFLSNVADGGGGGLLVQSGSAVVTRTTFRQNRANGNPADGFASYGGGGVMNQEGQVWIETSTFFGNVATDSGGAIYSHSFGSGNFGAKTTKVKFSTFVANEAAFGGGLVGDSETFIELSNSIIAGNTNGDCVGFFSGSGVNLTTSSDIISVCPSAEHTTVEALKIDLAPAHHGLGFGDTLRIRGGSSAQDRAGECDMFLDQNIRPRPDNITGLCDVGAFEIQDQEDDGVPDNADNCPLVENPFQEDLDQDGIGNACDADADGDGVGAGDPSPLHDRVCGDSDNDGCDDCSQSGHLDPMNDGPDSDNNGICNVNDPFTDTDLDGIRDLDDPFPFDRNACGDTDDDSCDDCAVAGARQQWNDGPDTDQDGVCDAGETDIDNDGLRDLLDNCPSTANPDQADVNGNGFGDACDVYAFQFLASNLRNVSVTGEPVAVFIGQISPQILLPFPFRFYGFTYSSLRISPHGFVTFTDSFNLGCCEGQDFPNLAAPNNLIAGFWSELSPFGDASSPVRTETRGTAPNREFVIGFYGVPHNSFDPLFVTFEIILHENGRVELQYGDMTDHGEGKKQTVGLESVDGRQYYRFQYGAQIASLLAHHGFLFTPPMPPDPLPPPPPPPVDSDGDGLPDSSDACPVDPLKVAPGACGCGVADGDLDGDGTADCLDPDDDNDGIGDSIDRDRATGADESRIASNDFWKDAETFGTVSRAGWDVTLADGAGGIAVSVRSVGGVANPWVSACGAREKRITFDRDFEAARFHCDGSSLVVDAVNALPKLEIEKLYCVGASCDWKVKGTLATGQHVKTGSPWEAGDHGTIPVGIVAPDGSLAGSFTLDPNESVNVEVTEGPAGNPAIDVTVLNGTVTVQAFGQSETLDESSGETTFTVDTDPPVITCGAAGSSWHNANVSIACSAQDAGVGLADGTPASFTLVTNVAAGVETANASTDSVTVCDAVNNCATASIGNIRIDRKAPVIACASPDGLWHADNVSIACSAQDGGSGVSAPDASFSLVTNVAPGVEDANAMTNSRDVCDAAGNCATAGPIGGIKVNRKTLSMTCSASAPSLWPANHKLVDVGVTVSITGGTFTLVSVTSSEPDNGLGDGDTAGDIAGWTIGSADVSGQLRAERSGRGSGRVYSLTYRGTDPAGRTASCTATVAVPKNANGK